jgi:hypothetical protein
MGRAVAARAGAMSSEMPVMRGIVLPAYASKSALPTAVAIVPQVRVFSAAMTMMAFP